MWDWNFFAPNLASGLLWGCHCGCSGGWEGLDWCGHLVVLCFPSQEGSASGCAVKANSLLLVELMPCLTFSYLWNTSLCSVLGPETGGNTRCLQGRQNKRLMQGLSWGFLCSVPVTFPTFFANFLLFNMTLLRLSQCCGLIPDHQKLLTAL